MLFLNSDNDISDNKLKDQEVDYKKKYISLNRSVLVSLAFCLVMTLIDLIRNKLTAQCLIVLFVFLLSENINKFYLTKNKHVIPIIVIFSVILIALLFDYIFNIVG